MTIRVKDWGTFQHFKDRRPPWVKLYRHLLDDIQWFQLEAEAAKLLISLWLLASESKDGDGSLPDIATISFRTRLPERDVIKLISSLSHWLEQDDTDEIQLLGQNDSPETETETETETEKETEADGARRNRELRQRASEIIQFLNERADRNFDLNGANAKHVIARLKEGETVADCRAVIALKVREWKGDPKMAHYLRPETLFNATKFASYKGELTPVEAEDAQGQ